MKLKGKNEEFLVIYYVCVDEFVHESIGEKETFLVLEGYADFSILSVRPPSVYDSKRLYELSNNVIVLIRSEFKLIFFKQIIPTF